MITFQNISEEKPFLKFREEYERALLSKQLIIEAMCVSSYCNASKTVDSRYVNLKIVDDKELIFFSNYNSPKSMQFNTHKKVAINIFWNTTNVQIRMKGNIKKASKKYNQKYFENRSIKKNALAISSSQSKKIKSYELVTEKYKNVLENTNLTLCPEHWGGFIFKPFYFEFWEGHSNRLNHRVAYELSGDKWTQFYLEP